MDYPQDTCFEVRAALPLYVGQDLEHEELRAVAEHLADCPACEELHARARDARLVLSDRRDELDAAPVPDLWSDVRVQLRDEGLLAPIGPRSLKAAAEPLSVAGRRHFLVVGMASAAAAILCTFLLTGGFQSGGAAGNDPLAGGDSGALVDSGSGAPVSATTPVVHPVSSDKLRRATSPEEALYPRAREMRAEQGLAAPEGAVGEDQ